uniref:Putative secreted protein n=1 Tax=Ixodes ricinus TaxID=34613 RepID=A0A6B0UW47_IXORI
MLRFLTCGFFFYAYLNGFWSQTLAHTLHTCKAAPRCGFVYDSTSWIDPKMFSRRRHTGTVSHPYELVCESPGDYFLQRTSGKSRSEMVSPPCESSCESVRYRFEQTPSRRQSSGKASLPCVSFRAWRHRVDWDWCKGKTRSGTGPHVVAESWLAT